MIDLSLLKRGRDVGREGGRRCDRPGTPGDHRWHRVSDLARCARGDGGREGRGAGTRIVTDAKERRRKRATLGARAPQVIAAGNIDGLVQSGAGAEGPVVRRGERLDRAPGGPCPRALSKTP